MYTEKHHFPFRLFRSIALSTISPPLDTYNLQRPEPGNGSTAQHPPTTRNNAMRRFWGQAPRKTLFTRLFRGLAPRISTRLEPRRALSRDAGLVTAYDMLCRIVYQKSARREAPRQLVPGMRVKHSKPPGSTQTKVQENLNFGKQEKKKFGIMRANKKPAQGQSAKSNYAT